MKKLACALALAGTCVLATSIASTPALALETYEAQMEASDAASQARVDMLEAFGPKALKPGQYVWRDVPADGPQRVVISLSDQLAYFYRGDTLVAASTISSGKDEKPTPVGIFSVLDKRPMYRSKNTTMRRCPGCSASTSTASRSMPATIPAFRPATAASGFRVRSRRSSIRSPTSVHPFISARNRPRAALGQRCGPSHADKCCIAATRACQLEMCRPETDLLFVNKFFEPAAAYSVIGSKAPRA